MTKFEAARFHCLSAVVVVVAVTTNFTETVSMNRSIPIRDGTHAPPSRQGLTVVNILISLFHGSETFKKRTLAEHSALPVPR